MFKIINIFINSSIAIMLLFFYTPIHAQQKNNRHFLIKGKINGLNNQYIYFSYSGYGPDRIWDSTIIKKHSFQFGGLLKGQAKCYISVRKDNKTNTDSAGVAQPFFIEAGTTFIDLNAGDFKQCIITGSRVQREWIQFTQQKETIDIKLQQLNFLGFKLNRAFNKAKGSQTEAAIEKQIEANEKNKQPLIDKIAVLDKNFIATHIFSLSATILLEQCKNIYTVKNLQSIFYRMPKVHQESPWGNDIKEHIKTLLLGAKGSVAANFSTKELRGDFLSLNDYKGKYVLLDFWASWCVPCRAANPQLVELYKKYQSSSIEFIGIADDDEAIDKWKTAIEKDGIGIWKQVLRGHISQSKNDDNDISKRYNIQSLPTQILVAPNGKIIERFGDGQIGNEKLSKVFEKLFDK